VKKTLASKKQAAAETPAPPKAADPKRPSAFTAMGFKATIEQLHEEIRELYLADEAPWIVGYSGGKDSTAILQLIWGALQGLTSEEKKKKPVHVISTDTLVENPIVAAWVEHSQTIMKKAAHDQGMPISPKRLTREP